MLRKAKSDRRVENVESNEFLFRSMILASPTLDLADLAQVAVRRQRTAPSVDKSSVQAIVSCRSDRYVLQDLSCKVVSSCNCFFVGSIVRSA